MDEPRQVISRILPDQNWSALTLNTARRLSLAWFMVDYQ